MMEHPVRRYVIQRIIQLIPVLIGITFLSFAMMRIAGSDAITELYGNKGAVAQEIIDAKRAELGLDQPFLTQHPVVGVTAADADRKYGNQLCLRERCVSDLYLKAPGNAAADCTVHFADGGDFNSVGGLGSGEP